MILNDVFVESVICRLAGTCMSDHSPAILLFLVTWVEKMTCWAGFKNGHCPGKGNGQYFYLRFQGWKFCIFAQQVIFSLQVSKNNRIVGYMPISCMYLLMGIGPIPRETSYKIIFMDFSWISAILQKQLKTSWSNRWRTREFYCTCKSRRKKW